MPVPIVYDIFVPPPFLPFNLDKFDKSLSARRKKKKKKEFNIILILKLFTYDTTPYCE